MFMCEGRLPSGGIVSIIRLGGECILRFRNIRLKDLGCEGRTLVLAFDIDLAGFLQTASQNDQQAI